MNLIDTHAHLFWESYKEDLDQVLQNALSAGIKTIFNVGVGVELSKKAVKLSHPEIKIYSTIAIHPEEAKEYWANGEISNDKLEKDIQALEEIYKTNPSKVIAVGECGLDYAVLESDNFNPEKIPSDILEALQKQLFQLQIDLAKKLDLPLIIHCRDDRSKNPENIECWLETLEMVKDYKGILHCYSGTMEVTKQIPDNFLVSFAGNLTYPKNDYLREAVKFLPLEKIVLETDCPFLPPQSIRGKRNEPSSVLEIAKLIAEIKETPLEEVTQITTNNVNKLFRLVE